MKKYMIKHKITLVASFACVVLMTSCKKYLNEQPVTSFGLESAFGSIDSAYQVLLGTYNQLTGDQGYGIRLNIYYPMGTDEAMNPSESNDGGRRSISRYEVDAANTELSKPFRQLYVGIERANICIDNIPKMKTFSAGSAEEQSKTKRMYGEALTLRAQFYLELIRNWGDVPALFLPAAKITEQYPQKVDRDVIYDKLIADLKEAQDYVPWRTEVPSDERITKGAVKALRAKIALYRGGYSLRRSPVQMVRGSNYLQYYQIARDECKAIMDRRDQHTLCPDYKTLFKNYVCGVKTPIDPYGELIFQVAMAGGSGSTDSKMGYACGPRVNNQGNNFVIIMPTTFYAYDSVDLRRDVAIAPYDVNLDGTKKGVRLFEMRDGKFRREWITPAIPPTSNSQYFSVNWPLIRFADVLLMFAEADNEINNGPSASAIAAFEEVRKRGYVGNLAQMGTTPTDKNGFFNAIVKERLLEFCGEGMRKYDLIRWNLLASKIAETKATLANMAAKNPPYQNLPRFMYYYNTSTADNKAMWVNSFYNPSPTSSTAYPGATRVNWMGTSTDGQSDITTTILTRFAIGFTPNKNELLPIHQSDVTQGNIPQDYGY